MPVLCRMSHTGQLKFADFLRSVGATSVRAGCRQVIDVVAIVIENASRPDNGRSFLLLAISGASPPVLAKHSKCDRHILT